MTDETNEPPARVSMRKGAAGRPDATPGEGPAEGKPQQVKLAFYALVLAGVFTVVTALGILGQRDWLTREQGKNNVKAVHSAVSSATASAAKKSQDVASASASASRSAIKNNPVGGPKLHDQVNTQIQGTLISTLLVVLVVAFLAFGAYRGRHWTRWGTTAFFILATFTGTGVGLFNALNAVLTGGAPLAVRIPTLIASLSMIAAVVLLNLRPSVAFLALSKPVPPAGMPQRRGLFGPRPAAGAARGGRPAAPERPARRARAGAPSKAPAATDPDRQPAKKRTPTDGAARGAELARSRAKASKSRRTER